MHEEKLYQQHNSNKDSCHFELLPKIDKITRSSPQLTMIKAISRLWWGNVAFFYGDNQKDVFSFFY